MEDGRSETKFIEVRYMLLFFVDVSIFFTWLVYPFNDRELAEFFPYLANIVTYNYFIAFLK